MDSFGLIFCLQYTPYGYIIDTNRMAGGINMILYRPVGTKELELIEKSGYTKYPPRLPEQPIFYLIGNCAVRRVHSQIRFADL